MRFTQSFLEELTARSDIVDVVSGYVTLTRHGGNLFGLCPFHNEKTPSFTLYPDTSSFYCFGCGAAGDVITFIRRIENLDYNHPTTYQKSALRYTILLQVSYLRVQNQSVQKHELRLSFLRTHTKRVSLSIALVLQSWMQEFY